MSSGASTIQASLAGGVSQHPPGLGSLPALSSWLSRQTLPQASSHVGSVYLQQQPSIGGSLQQVQAGIAAGAQVVIPSGDIAITQAPSSYYTAQKTIESIVGIVKNTVQSAEEWTAEMSEGCKAQLDVAGQKLEVELERKYQSLCMFDARNTGLYTKNHEEFIGKYVQELTQLRMEIVSHRVTLPEVLLSSSLSST